jgi:rubrerythrin
MALLGDSELSMRDVNQHSAEESPYECFECGNVVFTENNPGQCPDCAGTMRNRRTPIE